MIITAELVAQAGQMGLVTRREIGDGLVGVRELDGDRSGAGLRARRRRRDESGHGQECYP